MPGNGTTISSSPIDANGGHFGFIFRLFQFQLGAGVLLRVGNGPLGQLELVDAFDHGRQRIVGTLVESARSG